MKGVFRFRRQGMSFTPVGDEAKEALAAVEDGKEFMAEIRAPRRARQHRLFWALVGILAENRGVSKDEAKRNLCLATGYVEHWYEMGTGRLHIEPKSIAWESQSQAEFAQFFEAAIAKLCEWLGTAPDEVRERVYELVDGPANRGGGTGR